MSSTIATHLNDNINDYDDDRPSAIFFKPWSETASMIKRHHHRVVEQLEESCRAQYPADVDMIACRGCDQSTWFTVIAAVRRVTVQLLQQR